MVHDENGTMQDEIARLRAVAEQALVHSYAPYSQYPVGAAVMTVAGEIFGGCNVENAAFPLGLCAEANAIGIMVAARGPTLIRAVLVAVAVTPRAWPCGGCRQRLQEFAAEGAMVHAVGADGHVLSRPLAVLLPESFGPTNLGHSHTE